MSKKDDKIYRIYSSAINDISKDIVINILENDGSEPQLQPLVDRVGFLVNEFQQKFMSYTDHAITEAELEEVDNVLREQLLKIGSYYDAFIVDEEFLTNCGRKIVKLLIKAHKILS